MVVQVCEGVWEFGGVCVWCVGVCCVVCRLAEAGMCGKVCGRCCGVDVIIKVMPVALKL